ncbi:hypothetical protein BLOT_009758 [Blomia tropicalis]|nr:hypothetical protein BLOT_009758 [Blomia tropicalis]
MPNCWAILIASLSSVTQVPSGIKVFASSAYMASFADLEHNRTCAIIYITSNQSSKQATLIDSHHNCDTYQLTFYPIFLSNC